MIVTIGKPSKPAVANNIALAAIALAITALASLVLARRALTGRALARKLWEE